jgi:hypothetical protein
MKAFGGADYRSEGEADFIRYLFLPYVSAEGNFAAPRWGNILGSWRMMTR